MNQQDEEKKKKKIEERSHVQSLLGAANPPSFFRYSSLAQLHSLDAFFFLYG
jgi:hypothetical protein